MFPIAENNPPLCACLLISPSSKRVLYNNCFQEKEGRTHRGKSFTAVASMHPQGHLMFSSFQEGLSFGFFRRHVTGQQPSPFVS